VKNVDWQRRAQFFAITAQMMRRILVDSARARGSHQRSGGAVMVNVDEVPFMCAERDSFRRVTLDDAPDAFSAEAPRQASSSSFAFSAG
jgi:hypothetical protein